MSLDPSTSDNAGPLEIPELVPSSNGDDEKIKQNRTLVYSIYKEVWDEFCKWKVEDCISTKQEMWEKVEVRDGARWWCEHSVLSRRQQVGLDCNHPFLAIAPFTQCIYL